MTRDSIPGDIWGAIDETMDVEEGDTAQLVDPEVAGSLNLMLERLEGDR
jgi:hypothetical protein